MRPAVISFYSYKGGVGRTLLAANMAVALAREGKTLLWDMDVEAPGLHNIQALRNKGAIKAGFFDWLLDWQGNKLRPPGPQDLSRFAKLVRPTPFSQLFILPAHGDDADAAALYFGIDWGHLLGGNPPPGREVFNELFEHLGREGFRHVLIDTRTGLTDLGALLAGALPDATVLVGGYGRQNLKGLGCVHKALSQLDRNIRPSNTDLRLFPVASPIPQDDTDKVAAGRKLWSEAFGLQDIASVREIRYDLSLPFSEDLLITQSERAIAQDYERIYRDLSQFIDTLFAAEAAEQAEQDARPDIFDRDPSDPRASRAAQGKRFEDRVADLLRLLGYSVEREQLIGPDRVDLVARIESGLDTLTYFVECKDHKSAVAKEVVDLLGLWLRKPAAQAMHTRGMVVANAFSPAALASAKDLGITTATPSDLERRLLDFDKFLFQLVADFEQMPLAASYVTQRTQPEQVRAIPNKSSKDDSPTKTTAIEDLVAHGIEWASGRDSRLWVLLGDYGTGKTAFTEKLAYELAKRAMADGSAPVPLRVSLRDFPNKVRLEDLLAERWLQATGQRKDPKVLLHLIQRGRIVLLFDAFDEMGIATAGRSVVDQFRMLVGITANPGDTATGNRVLITCREQFFKDHGDALKAATGEQDRIQSSPLQDVAQRFDGAIHTVATFTPDQVRQFLVQRLGEAKGEEALTFLREQHMMELGDRPQLLDIIIASLPALKERQARSGEALSTGALYQTYTNKWLEDFKPAERQSTTPMLRSVLEELALLLWQRVGNRIHYGDLFALVKQRVDLRGQLDPNQLDVELRTAAFLSRTPDGLYGFSHRSFLEFFLARRIERSVCDPAAGDVAEVLNIPRLSAEVTGFLHDLVPAQDSGRRQALQQAVRGLMQSDRPEPAAAASRVNALWLAYRLAKVEASGLAKKREAMKDWIPARAYLAGLDLSEMPLIFLAAPGADFSNSQLTGCQLWAADLRGAVFNHADMRGSFISGAQLQGAQLQHVNASDVAASAAHLDAADATGSVWVNAQLQRAHLQATNFSQADLRAANLAESVGHPTLTGASVHGLTARNALGHWSVEHDACLHPPLRDLALAHEPGHVGSAYAVVFSPDGHHIASGGEDGTLRLWDVTTGQGLRVFEGHKGSVHSVAFSPDGRQIVSGGMDGTLRLWDTATGQSLRMLEDHKVWIHSVAFSPDGRHLASGCSDGTLRLWDATTNQSLRVVKEHKGSVHSVAFSPDGRQIISGGMDGSLHLWDAATGQSLWVQKEHKSSVSGVAFSPDGRQVASGGDDGTLRLWDPITGQSLRMLTENKISVTSMTFSPDGRLLTSGGMDGTIRVWDTTTGQNLRVIEGHKNWVRSVAFSPDGRHIASGGVDGSLRLWDATTGLGLRVIERYKTWVPSMAFSPDGRHIASGDNDGMLRLWDVATGQVLREFDAHKGWVNSVAFSPDGRHIASCGMDNTLRLWDTATGQPLRAFEGHKGWIHSVAFSPDGSHIASGDGDGKLRLWNEANGQSLWINEEHKGSVRSVAFSPDGRYIASGGDDGKLRLWDYFTGQRIRVIEGHNNWIHSVAFSPNGRHLASGSMDGTLRLWDAATGQSLWAIEGHMNWVPSVVFSPDGRYVASGGMDGTLRLWDATTGQSLRMVAGHKGWVLSVTFSPDGRQIASAGMDGTLRLWSAQGQELLRMRGGDHERGVQALGIPDAPLNWVSLDFRQDSRGLWSGQGEIVDTVRYVDTTEAPQPWPWVPRYWRASDVPELRAPASAPSPAPKTSAPRKRAARKPKA